METVYIGEPEGLRAEQRATDAETDALLTVASIVAHALSVGLSAAVVLDEHSATVVISD